MISIYCLGLKFPLVLPPPVLHEAFWFSFRGPVDQAGMEPALSNQFSNGTLVAGLGVIDAASNCFMDDPEVAEMQRELQAPLNLLDGTL